MIDVFRLIGVTALSANAGKYIVLPMYKSCFKIDKENKSKYQFVLIFCCVLLSHCFIQTLCENLGWKILQSKKVSFKMKIALKL